MQRALAIAVLVLVAIVAIRLAVGAVVGFVTALLWIGVLVALVAGGVWAWSTLRSGRKRRDVEDSSKPALPMTHEDRVDAEIQRISEQLRSQGRR
jgi:cytochrome c-type biogenesis protein CcmH/NrfF